MRTSGFEDVSRYLPQRIIQALDNVSNDIKHTATEIRLRAEKPIIIETFKKKFYLCLMGESYIDSMQNIVVSTKEIQETFIKLCESSVYSFKQEIENGFITIKNGHRVGIVGTLYAKESPRFISGLNIRLAGQQLGCSLKLSETLVKRGCFSTLIVGQPLSGKTTVLRDLVRALASEQFMKKVVVIDERSEIAACYKGVETMNLGIHTDILNGYSRKKGFEIATRTLSPDIIACDEIGSPDDVSAVVKAKHSGIDVIASAHAKDLADIMLNPNIRELIYNKCFDYICVLEKTYSPGQIKEIVEAERFYENYRCYNGNDSLFYVGDDDT